MTSVSPRVVALTRPAQTCDEPPFRFQYASNHHCEQFGLDRIFYIEEQFVSRGAIDQDRPVMLRAKLFFEECKVVGAV